METIRIALFFGLIAIGGCTTRTTIVNAGPSAGAGADGGSTPNNPGAGADAGALVFSNRLCSTDFCWDLPRPQGNTLYGVAATADDSVWAVGGGGALLHLSDGAWGAAATPQSATLHGVWASDDTNVWAVGENGTIVHFDGTSLATVASGTTETLFGVWGSAQDHVWAVGGQGSVLFYDGQSWTKQGSLSDEMHALWGSSDHDVYAVGGTLNVSTVGHYDGTSWKTIATGDMATAGLYAVSGTDASNVWAAGEYGFFYKVTPTGITDHGSTGSAGPTITALQVLSATDVWASAQGATYFFNGSAWSVKDAENGALAMSAAPGSTLVWLTGAGGAVRRSDAASDGVIAGAAITHAWVRGDKDVFVLNGADVMHYDGATSAKVGTASEPGAQNAFGGTSDGKVLLGDTENGADVVKIFDGTSWTTLPNGAGPLYAAHLAGSSATDVWEYYETNLKHFDGATWGSVALPTLLTDTELNRPVAPMINAMAVSSSSSVWVAGAAAPDNSYGLPPAYVARYDGATWTALVPPDSTSVVLDAIWVKSPSEVWVSGVFTDWQHPRDEGFNYYPSQPVLFHYDGASWSKQPIPDAFASPAYHSAQHAWIAGTDANHLWMVLSGDTNLPGNSYSWDGNAWRARPCPVGGVAGVWQTASATWVLGGGDSGQGLLVTK
jgi:hypothetical protein